MVLYWATLGTTGMTLEDGSIMMMILNNKDMVHPHPLHHGRGDQRTGECILP